MANMTRGLGMAALISLAGLPLATTSVLGSARPTGAQDKPTIYLTFDDGPSADSATGDLLDALADHGAIATFFIQGNHIGGREAVLRRIDAEGHALANHSWDHPELDSLSVDEINDLQLAQTHARVEAATGVDMTCFRSPWGTSYTHERELALITGFGYQVENHWDIDASEYVFGVSSDQLPGSTQTSAQIAATLATAEDGDVILLHDGATSRSAMVRGVELFLAEHGDDYIMAPLEECGGDEPGTTPPPAGPNIGPLADATTMAEVLAATDYTAADSDVLRLYHAFLAREPDVPGTVYWLELSHGGATLDDIAFNFSVSTEFLNRYGSLDDQAFITLIYGNVLGRTADTAGRDYWLEQVTSGQLSRHGVVRWIAAGEEFVNAHPYAPSGA